MARGGGWARPRGRDRLLWLDGERNGAPGPTQRAAEFEAPILALQAGDDDNILPEHNAAFEAALEAAGVEHELVVYDGAPHSFFDRRYDEFADASADAWERVLAFIAGTRRRSTPVAADSRRDTTVDRGHREQRENEDRGEDAGEQDRRGSSPSSNAAAMKLQ